MIFRQLFDGVSSTYSYLLASRHGGEALIIDPVLEKVDRYLQLVKELDLKLVKAVDTHIHADHITGLGRAARPHALHHRDGRDGQGRRGVDARHRGRQAHHRGAGARRALHAGPHRRFLQLPAARPGVHRRHAADPRHRPHRLPERQREGAVRVAVRQAPEAAGRDAGLSGPRLQGRYGLEHRRGEALQPAPAGEIGRRVRRPDGQAEPAKPEDDGRGRAGQHARGPGPGRDRAQGLGG